MKDLNLKYIDMLMIDIDMLMICLVSSFFEYLCSDRVNTVELLNLGKLPNFGKLKLGIHSAVVY